MGAYIVRRLLLMIPTLFGIMLVSFVIVQFAPGGPVERIIAQIQGTDVSATSRIGGSASGERIGQCSSLATDTVSSGPEKGIVRPAGTVPTGPGKGVSN